MFFSTALSPRIPGNPKSSTPQIGTFFEGNLRVERKFFYLGNFGGSMQRFFKVPGKIPVVEKGLLSLLSGAPFPRCRPSFDIPWA